MSKYDNEFRGKKALVTGGSKGIGAAVAQQLIMRGAKVAIAARTKYDETPVDAIFIQGDLSTAGGAIDVANSSLEALDGLDILINNVGAAPPTLSGIKAISDEQWLNAISINFMSAVRVTNPLIDALCASRSGAIVNISAGGLLPFKGFLADYGAAKAALDSYTLSLARELAPSGVRVNLVTPGSIITPGGDEGRKKIMEAMGISPEQFFSFIPLEGRAGSVEELSEAILFIVSDRASYITGTNQYVTGGMGNLA